MNILITSDGERKDPGQFLPKREVTSWEKWNTREDAKIHQQDSHDQAHESEDQDGPQDLSSVRRSKRIREVVEKMRESNKSSEMFTSIQ